MFATQNRTMSVKCWQLLLLKLKFSTGKSRRYIIIISLYCDSNQKPFKETISMIDDLYQFCQHTQSSNQIRKKSKQKLTVYFGSLWSYPWTNKKIDPLVKEVKIQEYSRRSYFEWHTFALPFIGLYKPLLARVKPNQHY